MAKRPLLAALDARDLDQLRRVLATKPRDLDTPSSRHRGLTPLALAAYRGDTEIVELLLAAGANPNRRGRSAAVPPLYYARNAAIARALIRAGARVDDEHEEEAVSPLIAAADSGNLEVVKALIEAGANPRHLSDGDEAHYFAARWGFDEVASYLERFYEAHELEDLRERGQRGRALLIRLGYDGKPSDEPI